jgi:hypothetical protein
MENISSGKYIKWKIFLVKSICKKAKNSHENGDDEKRKRKEKMPCKNV